MEQYGPISLLNRIYGIYEITMIHETDNDEDTAPNNGQRSSLDTDDADDDDSINMTLQQKRQQRFYLVVLNAVFDPSLTTTNETPSSRFRVYDIKGSTVGRQTKTTTGDTSQTNDDNDDLPPTVESSRSVTYKDLDLIQDINHNNNYNHNTESKNDDTNTTTNLVRLLHLNSIAKDQILQQLRNDVNFLTSCSVMDYSLLIGIEQKLRNDNVVNDDKRQRRNSFWQWNWNSGSNRELTVNTGTSPLSFNCGAQNIDQSQEKYHIGVIDFLQPYNYKKEIEYRWKSLIHPKNAYSCIPPDLYAQRFLDFIDKHVL